MQSIRRADFGIRPIVGMESVVATVSGYHGTERFEVIKLIERCGAYYVPAMNRSITHLVCRQFEGKKYDLARKLKTNVITHCWFEDCLKQGELLPEGPYTMQSGQEVGPISWKVPAIPEGYVKKIISHFGKGNLESNHNRASHSAKGKEIDLELLNWSDSHLLKEDSFHGWEAKNRLSNSQACRKSKRVLGKSHQYNKHKIALIDDLGIWPESSSGSSKRLRCRRNHHVDPNDEAYAGLTNAVEPGMLSNHPISENDECSRNRSVSSSLKMVPESRRIGDEGDLKEPHLVPSDSSEGSQMLAAEANPENTNSVERKTREGCGALLDVQAELSCVICWTEFCSSRGVLSCGHRFCYSCIQEWATCMALRGKMSTCPLCKANFTSITKFEDSVSSEQKIFSQTVPCTSSKQPIFCCLDGGYDAFGAPYSDSVCIECRNQEPEELLLSCHICGSQRVHSCCLDPPLIPWTCIHCRDLRTLYRRFR